MTCIFTQVKGLIGVVRATPKGAVNLKRGKFRTCGNNLPHGKIGFKLLVYKSA